MGSEQSTLSQKRQNRLSKPMTFGSNPNLLLEATEQAAAPQPEPAPTPDPVVITSNGTSRSRSDARHKIREQLFSRSIPVYQQEEVFDDSLDESSNFGSLTSRDRSSRSNSVKSFLPSARASSLSLLNSIGGSRLSLVAEGKPSEGQGSQLSRKESRDQLSREKSQKQTGTSGSWRERNGLDSLGSLSRRKSFLTPGIATRGGLSNPLRRPPQPNESGTQEFFDYYYNPKLPETSPLSQIAALDLADDRHTPRALTPCDDLLNSHLAGFRSGTLRITNGAASPVPSVSTVQSVRRTSAEEEFFSASEGRGSDDEEKPARKIRRQVDLASGPAKSKLSAQVVVHSTDDGNNSRPGSPLKNMTFPSSENTRRNVSISSTDTILRRRSYSHGDSPSPDKTSEIARSYIDELPDSPFSFSVSPAGSSSLTTASEISDVSDMEADSFEEAQGTDEKVVYVRGGSRDAALRILDGEQTPSPVQREFTLVPQRNKIRAQEEYSVNQVPVLAKVDSGYSSTVSERSSPRYDNEEKFLISNEFQTQFHQIYQEPASFTAPPVRAPPAIPFNAQFKELPKIPRRPVPQHAPQPSSVSAQDYNSRPAVPRSSISGPVQTIVLADTSSDSDEEMDIKRSPKSKAKKRQEKEATARRKLQKRRPLSQPAPLPVKLITVQGYREIGQAHIPPVPSEILAKNAGRQLSFPTLEHTFPSHRHTTMVTETTVQSAAVPIRFPSPSPRKPQARPQSAVFGHPPPQRDYSSINPLRSDRRSSWHRNPGTAAATITDFGTVAESLGIGPYEAARIAASQSQPHSNAPSISPHSIGAQTRSRSAMTMDDTTASEFARERSTMLRSRTQDRNFSRPISMHASTSWSQPQQGQALNRPRSLVFDSPPPVPRLPTTNQPNDLTEQYFEYQEEHELARNTRMNQILTLPENTPDTQTAARNTDKKRSFLGLKNSTENLASSWAAHKASWKERRRSAGEALMRKSSIDGMNKTKEGGRYQGGLQYGYEPGIGVGGSAGTRSAGGGDSRGERHEGAVGPQYGIDFGDVPVIIRA